MSRQSDYSHKSSRHRRNESRSSKKSREDYRDRLRDEKSRSRDSDSSRDGGRERDSRRYRRKSRSPVKKSRRRSFDSSSSSSSLTSKGSNSNSSKAKLPTMVVKDTRESESIKPESSVLEMIEAESFVARPFESKRSQNKVIIDLQNDVICVPTVENVKNEDTFFHPKFLGNDQERFDKWTRKLFNYRQKSY